MEELLEVLVEGNFSDEVIEDVILFDLLNDTDKRDLKGRYGEFDFYSLTEDECNSYFRFTKDDVVRLKNLMKIPDIKTEEGFFATGLDAFCIFLRRLSYPNRLVDLEKLFGRSESNLSSIFNSVLRYLHRHIRPFLQDLQNIPWLNRERLHQYANAVENKGSPLPNCWGFMDGTARAICRPSHFQRDFYSGHKRGHMLKYQSVICPDGLILHLGGPYPGRRHDSGILRESKFYTQLERIAKYQNETFVLYADQGYPLRELIITPYQSARITPAQKAFNVAMSSVRQCVEWGFGKVAIEFAFVDFRKNQKIMLQLVPEMYLVAVFLTNCHTCLYGSQTSHYFSLDPPSLEDYLRSIFP